MTRSLPLADRIVRPHFVTKLIQNAAIVIRSVIILFPCIQLAARRVCCSLSSQQHFVNIFFVSTKSHDLRARFHDCAQVTPSRNQSEDSSEDYGPIRSREMTSDQLKADFHDEDGPIRRRRCQCSRRLESEWRWAPWRETDRKWMTFPNQNEWKSVIFHAVTDTSFLLLYHDKVRAIKRLMDEWTDEMTHL